MLAYHFLNYSFCCLLCWLFVLSVQLAALLSSCGSVNCFPAPSPLLSSGAALSLSLMLLLPFSNVPVWTPFISSFCLSLSLCFFSSSLLCHFSLCLALLLLIIPISNNVTITALQGNTPKCSCSMLKLWTQTGIYTPSVPHTPIIQEAWNIAVLWSSQWGVKCDENSAGVSVSAAVRHRNTHGLAGCSSFISLQSGVAASTGL